MQTQTSPPLILVSTALSLFHIVFQCFERAYSFEIRLFLVNLVCLLADLSNFALTVAFLVYTPSLPLVSVMIWKWISSIFCALLLIKRFWYLPWKFDLNINLIWSSPHNGSEAVFFFFSRHLAWGSCSWFQARSLDMRDGGRCCYFFPIGDLVSLPFTANCLRLFEVKTAEYKLLRKNLPLSKCWGIQNKARFIKRSNDACQGQPKYPSPFLRLPILNRLLRLLLLNSIPLSPLKNRLKIRWLVPFLFLPPLIRSDLT